MRCSIFHRSLNPSWARGSGACALRFDPHQEKPKYFFGQGRLFSARLVTGYQQVSPMRRTLPWLKM